MLIDRLKAIVGEGGWVTDARELEPHLTEWREVLRGRTAIMVSPRSTSEVSAVMRACHEAGVGVVPQGGNTGLCGGAIPDTSGEQVLLSLSRLNRIRQVDADDFSLVAEAGCILADVQNAAEAVDLLFPLSLSAEGSCQIGGNLSTNAGGINVLRYGTARQQVLGLEVVLADGSVWDGLRALRKDTAGYDLKQLFLGSEGTLGVITAAVLRLFPRPGNLATVFVAIGCARTGVALLGKVRKQFSDSVQAFELISGRALDFVLQHIPDSRSPFEEGHQWYLLMDIDTGDDETAIESLLGDAVESGDISDVVIAKSGAEAQAFWRLRHAISEAQKHEGASLKHDIAVPVGDIADFLLRAENELAGTMPGLRPVIFGHVGDGNLHYNISRPVKLPDRDFYERGEAITGKLYELVTEFGGTISAEHGIGVLKRAALAQHRSPLELELMRRVKAALDPKGILNPGKVI